MRAKAQLSDHLYLQAAVYDGVPGDPNNPRGTHVKHPSGDGYFYAAETGLVAKEDESYYKLAVGGWYHTADFEDFDGESRDKNHGIYLIGEKKLFSEDDPDQGLGAFFQTGFARADRNQLGQYFGAGFSYQGAIPGRDSDNLSLGLAVARNGSDFRDANPELNTAEVAIELTYRAEVTPYFAVQPDFQYIFNPGTDPALKDAVVLGFRTEVRM